jgi:hypothetical protein
MTLSIVGLVNFAIALVVLGLVFWLLLYIINTIPMFAPFREVARVVITVLACLVLIIMLLNLIGIVHVAAITPLWQTALT